MKKVILSFLATAICVPVMSLALAVPVLAQSGDADYFFSGGNEDVKIDETLVLGNKDPRNIAAQVINIILGFLGIIAVVIILFGGFKWMTAGGNQDKIDEAKQLITAGVIGLVIILASFGIATFVLNALVSATGA